MPQYTYDQAWHSERDRLAGIEAMWDPGSQRLIQDLELGAGARVLEIGAGGGALAEWLCDHVGPDGQVVATDLDTRFLDAIERPNLTVLTHDIVNDAPPAGGFDLIHSRLVLEHIAEREAVIDKLVGALSDGGVLLLEDYDFGSNAFHPRSEAAERVVEALVGFMQGNGFSPLFGRELPGLLKSRGLVDVESAGRVLLVDSEHPGSAFFRLTLEQLAPVLVAQELVAREDVDELLASFGEPGLLVVTPTMFGAWGRAT
jgi:SAM-dependent methyltransferase